MVQTSRVLFLPRTIYIEAQMLRRLATIFSIMHLPAYIFGFFYIAVIGSTEASYSGQVRSIIEEETEICERLRQHFDVNGCGGCVCRSRSYGTACKIFTCKRPRERPIEEGRCTPFTEFTTRCHLCKCSPNGIPTACIEKRPGCVDHIVDDFDDERFGEENRSTDLGPWTLDNYGK